MSRRTIHLRLLTVFVLILVGVIVVVWVRVAPLDPSRRAARELQVSVPAGASVVLAQPQWIEWQGFCSALAFLVPDDQAGTYTRDYFESVDIPNEGAVPKSCAGAPNPCDTPFDGGIAGAGGITASDTIDNGTRETERRLVVVRGCRPGQTLISWSAGYS